MIRLPSADAFTGRVSPLWRGLAAIVLLCGLILALVESRASILRSGTEIRLATAPLDPRDLFRGDYVILSYRISTLEPAKLDGDRSFERNQTVFVRVAPGADGLAEAKGVYLSRPPAPAGGVVLEGKVVSTAACAVNPNGDQDCNAGRSAIRVEYGLESYFVPEGTGRAIETTERKRLEIVAAVSSSGQAAIKRLLIDGKLVHQEPPY